MLTVERLAQEVAGEVIRLQGTAFGQLLAASEQDASALAEQLGPVAARAFRSWEAAAQEVANHLFLVLRNNPDTPLQEVLARPDVQAVLRTPFERATEEVQQAIREAWLVGESFGEGAARRDLSVAGIVAPQTGLLQDRSVLDRVLEDARANGEAARDRFLAVVREGDPEQVRASLLGVGRGQAFRAAYGAQHAGTYAAWEQKEEVLRQAERESGVVIWKVWVTRFGPGTCPMCAALHGTRRRLGEPFPHDARFGDGRVLPVYGDVLGHPPRHPNCRCRIVLHLSRFEDEGPTLGSMFLYAWEWFQGVLEGLRSRRRRRRERS